MSVHEQFADDLALYALGGLQGDESTALEKHRGPFQAERSSAICGQSSRFGREGWPVEWFLLEEVPGIGN